MKDELLEMDRDVATKIMEWNFEEKEKSYFVLFNEERYEICKEDEFRPSLRDEDAMKLLHKFEEKYNIELRTEINSTLIWYCTLNGIDSDCIYKGEGGSIGFALCEALLESFETGYIENY